MAQKTTIGGYMDFIKISEDLKLSIIDGFDFEDENYMQWFNNPYVCRFNSHHTIPVTNMKTKRKPDILLGIEYREPGTLSYKWIGNVALDKIDYINSNAELSIIIGETGLYSKGIGSKVCKTMVEHGFNSLNLHKIYLGTSIDNIGMRNIATKLLFKIEGERTDAMFKNGRYVDVIEYGLLRSEYFGK